MLTREQTTELLQELKAKHLHVPAEDPDSSDSLEAAGNRRHNVIQMAMDWVENRGNTYVALVDFVQLFKFSNEEVEVALEMSRKAEYRDVTPSYANGSPATVAAFLMNNWLNRATSSFRSPNIEREYARMLMLISNEAYETECRLARVKNFAKAGIWLFIMTGIIHFCVKYGAQASPDYTLISGFFFCVSALSTAVLVIMAILLHLKCKELKR